ncbi:MAG: DUF1311 domain-containing protein [Burkholderiaceae bacterium]|jgi:uncharacterized protein YecT (DUF1311 family)|nr:DUF1311 domain-containing protein [Burkholderiaceae bacterium]
MMKLIGLGLAACFPVSALAASAAPIPGEWALRGQCSGFSMTGIHACLAKKAASSQKALRHADRKVLGILAKSAEEPERIGAAKTRLAASTQAFANYREKQCAFAYSLGGGAIGAALELRRFACVAELNNRQARQLRDAVSGMPPGASALRECAQLSEAQANDCLARKAANSQKALRQAEKKVLGLLSQSQLADLDESMGGGHKYVNRAKTPFTAANRAFPSYRDAQCEFLASLEKGGAMGAAPYLRRSACVAELNDRRTQQLRDAASHFPLNCSASQAKVGCPQ